MGADPGWIIWATHVANLVNPGLEGGDSAADKGPQEIIARYTCLHKLIDDLVNLIDLEVRIFRVKVPLVLLRGGTETECRQVQKINIVRALHVENVRCHFRHDSRP